MSTADANPTGAALIGVGMVSATYAQALADLAGHVELTGALGRSPGSGAAFLAKHMIGADKRAYGSVREVAEDPAVDFVLLTTPPNARTDIVETLAAAGKPILMEKPVERTLAAAIGLCETCEAHGVPLGIMLQHRIRPSVRALVERQQGGGFGALRAVEISVPWWRAQSYYDEPGRGSYERDGGGVLISQAIHTIDLALQFTGPVAEVVALSATTGFHRMESEDFVSAGLQFAGGAVGTLFASTASFPGRTEEIILHYENGSARLQSNLLMLDWQDGRSETICAAAASGAGADPMAFTSDWHRMMIEDFRDSLATGRAPLAAGRSTLPAHALIEAIEESGKTGARCAVKQMDGE